jgi:CDP-6-deoxy-D-xylo-4-hexulose-3-dehydrase
MEIKPIKLVSDTIDRDDVNKLIEWLKQDPIPKLSKGVITIQFEEKFANYIGTKYSVFVNSGSSAILMMLYALLTKNRLKNKKIVVPNISWVTDVTHPIHIGLTPLLCDCNLNDLSVDLTHLEQLFKDESPSALLLVSVLGLSPNMDKIVELCNKYDVILLEDFCESLGSKFNNKNIGTFGLMSCTSTYYGHTMATIEGGIIFTDDYELYNQLKMIRSHGWDRDLDKQAQDELRTEWNVDGFKSLYTFYTTGFNLRSTDLQAFIGLSQLDKLDSFIEKRNKNFLLYNELIKNNQVKIDINQFISNFAYPIINPNRKLIVDELNKNNIEVRPLISGSMGRQPFWIDLYGEQRLPNSDLVDDYGFYIPNHQDLTETEIRFICSIINKY